MTTRELTGLVDTVTLVAAGDQGALQLQSQPICGILIVNDTGSKARVFFGGVGAPAGAALTVPPRAWRAVPVPCVGRVSVQLDPAGPAYVAGDNCYVAAVDAPIPPGAGSLQTASGLVDPAGNPIGSNQAAGASLATYLASGPGSAAGTPLFAQLTGSNIPHASSAPINLTAQAISVPASSFYAPPAFSSSGYDGHLIAMLVWSTNPGAWHFNYLAGESSAAQANLTGSGQAGAFGFLNQGPGTFATGPYSTLQVVNDSSTVAGVLQTLSLRLEA